MDETYNGWTNRATWAVALHVNNDQGWQEQIHELVKQQRDERLDTLDEDVTEIPEDEAEDFAYDVAEVVKDSVTSIVDPQAYIEEFGDVMLSDWANGPGMAARDIGDLDDVNWHELAESFIRDVREN